MVWAIYHNYVDENTKSFVLDISGIDTILSQLSNPGLKSKKNW